MPDPFLQLTISVLVSKLKIMRDLTFQDWLQVENITNFYLRIKYSLVDNVRKSFISLQL